MKFFKIFGILILAAGCSTSNITSSWSPENGKPTQFKNIVVMGLISNQDRALQERMEQHLADDIKALGYNVVSAVKTYGPKYFAGMDEKTAISKLNSDRIDAVVTIVLLDRDREKYYVPGRVYYSPYGFYQNRFWNYQGVLYNRIYEPGYYVENTIYFWESNLYRLSDQKLIYSAQSKSFDPKSSEQLAHEYGRLIIKDMLKQNILQDKIIE